MEQFNFKPEGEKAKLEVESGYSEFVPDEFRQDPLKYFEENGVNIKSGEVLFKETGEVKEDPTAVKDLPIWCNAVGEELATVGKKVNAAKAKVGESGDPFYEYKIMEIAREFGLPAPRPVAKVEQDGNNLIVMEKVAGLRWVDTDARYIREKGFAEEDFKRLKQEAEMLMEHLRVKYEAIGLKRNWKLKDMVFDLDFDSKTIRSITPTDWERTKINEVVLSEARRNYQELANSREPSFAEATGGQVGR